MLVTCAIPLKASALNALASKRCFMVVEVIGDQM
jgi:hypothetical protein